MTNAYNYVTKGQLQGVFIGLYHIISAQSPCGFLEINVKFVQRNDTGPGCFWKWLMHTDVSWPGYQELARAHLSTEYLGTSKTLF